MTQSGRCRANVSEVRGRFSLTLRAHSECLCLGQTDSSSLPIADGLPDNELSHCLLPLPPSPALQDVMGDKPPLHSFLAILGYLMHSFSRVDSKLHHYINASIHLLIMPDSNLTLSPKLIYYIN